MRPTEPVLTPSMASASVYVASIPATQAQRITKINALRADILERSKSRRRNWHVNAVAGRSLNLLKRDGIRRRTGRSRDEALRDAFDCIEMFCNPMR